MGRWGTEAVLGYVRLALLAMSHTWAARASAGPALGAQLGTVVSRSTQPHDSEVLGVRACWGALKSELQRELAKLQESSTRAESDTSRSEEGCFWLNTETGVAHGQQCILGGCSPRPFSARCGWQARESDAVVCTDVLLASHKSLCERCFPYLREQRRRRLMSSSLMQDGVKRKREEDSAEIGPSAGE